MNENLLSVLFQGNYLKDVRANCFWASLLRTQIQATSSISARALSIKTSNNQRLANAGEDDSYFLFLVMKDLKAHVEKGFALRG